MSQNTYNREELKRAMESVKEFENVLRKANNVIEGNFGKLTKEEELAEVLVRS